MRSTDAAGLIGKMHPVRWPVEAYLLARIVFCRSFSDCLREWRPDMQRHQTASGNEPGLQLSMRGSHGRITIGIAEHVLVPTALALRDAEPELPGMGLLLAQSAYEKWLACLPATQQSWINALDLQIVEVAPAEGMWPPRGWPSWQILRPDAAPVRMAVWDMDIEMGTAVLHALHSHYPISLACNSLCVPAQATLETFHMPALTIGSLQPGDVLVNPVISQSAGRVGWLVIGRGTQARMRVRAEFAPDGIKITGGLEMANKSTAADLAMNGLCPPQQGTNEADISLSPALTQLDLSIEIELGRYQLKLGEVASIEPGYMLDTRIDLANPIVRILVSGQPFAIGRLVAIGECFGVCIDTLIHQAGWAHAGNN